MKRVSVIAGLVFLLAAGAGCADFDAFMRDRGNDFADCFKGDVGCGVGLGAHVRATEFLSVGAGAGYMWKYGFKGRKTGEWTDILIGWPVSNFIFAFNVLPEMSSGTTIGNNGSDVVFWLIMLIPMNHAAVGRMPRETGEDTASWEYDYFPGGFATHSVFGINVLLLAPHDPEERPEWYECPPIEMFDIEAGIMAGGVSVHFGFSPGQFLDFLLGWFGADPAGDDLRFKSAPLPDAILPR
jgi:hypothetical protein